MATAVAVDGRIGRAPTKEQIRTWREAYRGLAAEAVAEVLGYLEEREAPGAKSSKRKRAA